MFCLFCLHLPRVGRLPCLRGSTASQLVVVVVPWRHPLRALSYRFLSLLSFSSKERQRSTADPVTMIVPWDPFVDRHTNPHPPAPVFDVSLLFFRSILRTVRRQWQEPEEARPPTKKWRLYVFKGDSAVGACAYGVGGRWWWWLAFVGSLPDSDCRWMIPSPPPM